MFPKVYSFFQRRRRSRINALVMQIGNFLLGVYPEILNRTRGLGMEEGIPDHPAKGTLDSALFLKD